MKTVETENEGLLRAYTLTIPAKDIDARVDGEVKRIAPTIRMPGFRPGKVPPNLIRKMHGEALMRDALNTAVQDSVQKLMADKKLRPAMQPEVELDERYETGKDAEVHVRLETLPDVPTPKIEGLKLERFNVEVDEKAVDEQLKQLAASQTRYEDAKKGQKAGQGDQVVIDFTGKVDGVAFDGGTGTDMAVVLGSGQLIPGFEDQLVGAKAGDEKQIQVTFPADYPAENLKSQPATFDIKVKSVKVASETKLDDAFAKQLGLSDLEQLKGLLRDQQRQELNGLTRTHMKRRLLDQLAAGHDFDVPPSMVEAEYQNIMAQLRHEASHEPDPETALKEIEADAEEYRSIAVRRVRLGLLLSEIGSANNIEVSQQEMNRLVGQAAAQYQPKDREAFVRYIQQNPMAAAQLRAPLYEDKVVDFLFSKSEIEDRTVARAVLEADLESEEGHVHGPGCGHDHGEEKPKKAAAKKPAAKKVEAKPAEAKAEPKKTAKKAEAAPAKAEKAAPKKVAAKPEPKAEAKKVPAKKAPAKKAPAKKK
ncbi:MAG: trigger factor [Sphingomicrobium sp.]